MSDRESPEDPTEGKDVSTMSLARACWSITAFVFLVVGVVLLFQGYGGYAIVTLVIGVAAAINLF